MKYYCSGTMAMNAPMQTSGQFGAVIRARRKRLKITQKELAMTCGTGLRFIVDLERGKPTCQIGKALQVLQALGLAVVATPLGSNDAGGPPP